METKTKPRWFRFSLRTMLIVVAITSAGFGFLGMKMRAKQREREAVKAIQELSGDVLYDNEDRFLSVPSIPPGPAWLRKLFGDDVFTHVASAWCGPQTADADLRHLADFRYLKVLRLNSPDVTDVGLVHLHGLTELKGLTLDGTQVTDAGVEKLQNALPNLSIRW